MKAVAGTILICFSFMFLFAGGLVSLYAALITIAGWLCLASEFNLLPRIHRAAIVLGDQITSAPQRVSGSASRHWTALTNQIIGK
ncbi:MAG: hypothetical protein AAGI30_07620 [Planctomycetota bacterium]